MPPPSRREAFEESRPTRDGEEAFEESRPTRDGEEAFEESRPTRGGEEAFEESRPTRGGEEAPFAGFPVAVRAGADGRPFEHDSAAGNGPAIGGASHTLRRWSCLVRVLRYAKR